MGHVKISECEPQQGPHGNSVTLYKCVTIELGGSGGANFEPFQ